jgi:hypothetical protein
MSPSGSATATPTLTSPCVTILSPAHDAFTIGNFLSALAQALMRKSLYETFVSCAARICSRSATAWSMSISTVT